MMMAGARIQGSSAWARIGPKTLLGAWLLAGCCTWANAGLFDDDEARRAILELRQRVDEANTRAKAESSRLNDENAQLRKALLDFQAQIDQLKQEQARLRGLDEQRTKDLSDLQMRQRETALNVDDRLRRFEPLKVNHDGVEFTAMPAEKAEYEAALGIFRKGDFAQAQQAFQAFLNRYANSGYVPSSLFWLGNAQFASREFKESVGTFKQLAKQFPDHPRSPEAMLSLANAQVELKDVRGAKKTLEDLVRAYPKSEAAGAARDRIPRMK